MAIATKKLKDDCVHRKSMNNCVLKEGIVGFSDISKCFKFN